MREWQSLLQVLHVYAGCWTEWTQSFLRARLSGYKKHKSPQAWPKTLKDYGNSKHLSQIAKEQLHILSDFVGCYLIMTHRS